ncbi:nucleoside-diphosphate kinase [Dehalococcoidia bacterium]|nr:nucleoside-diphosphate kinase [Dehalococcoidia bacterium]
MSSERSLVLVKPDGVQRGISGVVISKLESRGLKIVGMKLFQISRELATSHYGAHQGKPFFDGLVNFIISGPVVAMVVEGPRAVAIVRNTMGSTDPLDAQPGTIRGDFGIEIGRNLVHGSDSSESAQHEISLFFSDGEIIDYDKGIDTWIIES